LDSNFFGGHTHRTVFNGEESLAISISASIIQGSGIGPASYAVTAAYLRPMHSGNSLVKFADDTYRVFPSANVGTRTLEIHNIATWVAANNLRLNVAKTREIVFRNPRRKTAATPLPSLPSISRENST